MAVVSPSKIIEALREVRSHGRHEAQLLLVGRTLVVAPLARTLSAGARGAGAGLAPVIDVLEPDDCPREVRALRRWSCVVFVESADHSADDRLRESVAAARAAGVPVSLVLSGRAALSHKGRWMVATGAYASEVVAWDEAVPASFDPVARRIAEAVGQANLSLAAALPAVRGAVVERIIHKTSMQNAAIGAAVVIPGPAMPAITANQIRMVLLIAAAYGEEMGLERSIEILSIVGAAFGWRFLAREALAFVPGPGWAVKGAVGYTGTLAVGKSAVAYFEAGAPLTPSRLSRLKERFDGLRARRRRTVEGSR